MYDNLFDPIAIGSTELKGRIVRGAHASGTKWSDHPTDLIAYHAVRAKSGVAMIALETGGVHSTSPATIPVYDDGVVRGYRSLMSALRPYGMKIFQQLSHLGSAKLNHFHGGPPWSASDVPNPIVGVVPHPMTQNEIDEIIEAFGLAAGRAKAGGLDGVEVHAAHGYLIGQFLSPLTNRRVDKYGGKLENRTRFLLEILRGIRSVVGDDFPIGLRLSVDEEAEGGNDASVVAEIARLVDTDIDYFSASLGTYYKFHTTLDTLDAPLGYELPKVAPVRAVLTVPTIVTGRITTLAQASDIVATGQADMVSIVRALIADPDLISKSRDGRAGEVRPCVFTNEGCIGSLRTVGRLECTVNLEAGAEARIAPEAELSPRPPKRVVVVGGGPAGLQTARTAAVLGHQVTLFEATRTLGGHAAVAARAPHRAEFASITDWLAEEIGRLKVHIKLGTAPDVQAILALAPDLVVVATGSRARRDGFQIARPTHELVGASLQHVCSSWDLLSAEGSAVVGRTALVYDDLGGFEAISVAEELLARGASVTFATRLPSPGANVPDPKSTVWSALERLDAKSVSFRTHCYLDAINVESVVLRSALSESQEIVPAETVVLVGAKIPNDDLARELRARSVHVEMVGDVYTGIPGGQGLGPAIREAARLARNI